MRVRIRVLLLLTVAVLIIGISASTIPAQDMPMPMPSLAPKATLTPSPKQTPSPSPSPTSMQMPSPRPIASPMPVSAKPTPSPRGETLTLPDLSPGKDFPEPVSDSERYGSTLFDVFEFRPGRRGDSDFRWDIEGSYGGDYNRFWYKSEGERNTAFKADYDIDLQLLYGRLISPYFNFQMGVRFETQTFRGTNVTRPQAVVGLEGLLPYVIDFESAVFIDPKGNLSGRASLTKEFLFTNHWIMQARFETNAAVQKVERFTTGQGLNNMETGVRLRYEFNRKFAPYIGVTLDRSFFETARLVRQDGGDPSQVRIAIGVRMLF